MKGRLYLGAIIALAITLRVYGQNWDLGFHLHPDERMLIMVTSQIRFFSNLNPNFFNYGSLPVYLLAASAQIIDAVFKTEIFNYNGLLFLGRSWSAVFDLFTLLALFKIAQLLFGKKTAFLASFVYAVSFFPIQNAHFFVVDPLLTFFLTATLYVVLLQNSAPSKKYILLTALLYGASLATKITALVVYPVVIIGLLLPYAKNGGEKTFQKKILISARMTILPFLFFNFSLLLFHFVFMPYAYIEYARFIFDISQQVKMNSNPYVFPYTLQYVGTIPYWYYLKNIFLWGMGPIFSTLALIGFIQTLFILFLSNKCTPVIASTAFSLRERGTKQSTTWYQRLFHTFTKTKHIRNDKQDENDSSMYIKMTIYVLFFCFYLLYFLVIGKSAVKFMRYMLPLYPFFALCAGIALGSLLHTKFIFRVLCGLLCIAGFIYTFFFMHIYTQPTTRLQATAWIASHIPPHSTIALEHWDDQVPLYSPPNYYTFVQLQLYNQPDNKEKWKIINAVLRNSDYLVIASNRLFIPITHLTDCKKFATCFPIASKYYADLFAEKREFKKVAEFSVQPQLTLGNYTFTIPDQSADESFTVYDHPTVMIFKRQ